MQNDHATKPTRTARYSSTASRLPVEQAAQNGERPCLSTSATWQDRLG
jgi:hypothetical protein